MDDPRRRFLFSVHGDAGIRKTYLVRQLARVARERSYRTAYVDEALYDAVSVIEAIASQLAEQGARFPALKQRLETYRERRRELDNDPGAPDGLSSMLTRSAVRVGLRAAGDIPIVGGFAEELDPKAGQLPLDVSRWGEYLSIRADMPSEVFSEE